MLKIFNLADIETKKEIAKTSHKFASDHGYSAPAEIEAFYEEMHSSQEQTLIDSFLGLFGY